MAAGAAWADTFSLSYEPPAVTKTTVPLTYGGLETFDKQTPGNFETFDTNFDTGGKISGAYTNVIVKPADLFGGVGGTGYYADALGFDTMEPTSYSLNLSTTNAGGLNYFGAYMMAVDHANQITFYNGTTEVGSFNLLSQLPPSITRNPKYDRNPWRPDNLGGQPFVFVNFIDTTGTFDRVVFSETDEGGFESDNQMVGLTTLDSVSGNLLVDGSFDSGALTGWTEKSYPGSEAAASSTGFDIQTDGKDRVTPTDGAWFARLVGSGCKHCLHPAPNGNLSQTVSGLKVGEHLTLIYYENDTDSGRSAPLDVKFGAPGDLERYTPTAIGAPNAGGWQKYEVSIVADAPKETVSFQFQTAPGYFYGLDDVSLVDPPFGVPEPANWVLMVMGLGLLGGTLRAKRLKAAV